jgi:hypothetical protein
MNLKYCKKLYGGKSLKIRAWLFILLICAACSTKQSLDPSLVPKAEYLEQNPLPLPDFFTRTTGQYQGAESFEIDGKALWEPGDSSPAGNDSYSSEFTSRLKITIDGKAVPEEKLMIRMHLAPDYVFNKDGTIIGMAAYWLIDISTDYLSSGLHIAMVSVITTSGKLHSYTWAFRVKESLTSTPAISPAPTPTP